MSLFPNFTHEFSPLLRLLDDFNRPTRPFPQGTHVRTFAPKFDISEVKDAYELQGELPGVNQENINIEWNDGNTITISGRSEQLFESGEKSGEPRLAAEGGHVEANETKEASHVREISNTPQSNEIEKPQLPRYWVSERSVGEFHRSFSFPSRVDQDAVKASLKNGILSIVVPKAAEPKPRRIQIE